MENHSKNVGGFVRETAPGRMLLVVSSMVFRHGLEYSELNAEMKPRFVADAWTSLELPCFSCMTATKNGSSYNANLLFSCFLFLSPWTYVQNDSPNPTIFQGLRCLYQVFPLGRHSISHDPL